jgi:hypothetical protein
VRDYAYASALDFMPQVLEIGMSLFKICDLKTVIEIWNPCPASSRLRNRRMRAYETWHCKSEVGTVAAPLLSVLAWILAGPRAFVWGRKRCLSNVRPVSTLFRLPFNLHFSQNM